MYKWDFIKKFTCGLIQCRDCRQKIYFILSCFDCKPSTQNTKILFGGTNSPHSKNGCFGPKFSDTCAQGLCTHTWRGTLLFFVLLHPRNTVWCREAALVWVAESGRESEREKELNWLEWNIFSKLLTIKS